jgi:hypothetical protein
MEFERYKGLYVTGSLQATGVIFTSADPQPARGDWSGIHFETTATGSLLQGCQVLYAGSDSHGGNVNISSPNVEIRNCTIAHSDWHGIVAVAEASLIGNTIEHNDYCAIHVTGDSSEILASGNSASNNEHNGICVEGAISADTHWCSNSPYVLYDDVAVGVDETLSICPGVTVEGTLYHGLTVSGALHASGVTFTASRMPPDRGDWRGIRFEPTCSASLLEDCEVRYGGGYSHGGNIDIGCPHVTIRDCDISDSDWHGIVAEAEPTLIENSITNNDYCAIHATADASGMFTSGNTAGGNMHDGICVEGSMSNSKQWCSVDLPYVLYDDVAVGVDRDLTLCSSVRVQGTLYHGLTVSGSLHGSGLTFTSSHAPPGPGDWRGIRFEPTCGASLLEDCEVRYGGGYSHGGNIDIGCPHVTIRDCDISDSDWHGIVAEAEPTLIENSITNNDNCAIHTTADASGMFTSGNTAGGNMHDGICVEGSMSTNKEWCSVDLPYILYDDVAVVVDRDLAICNDVTVLGDSYHELDVSGSLHATGATFTSAKEIPGPGDWVGIRFEPTCAASLIERSGVLYAGSDTNGGNLNIGCSDVTIRNTVTEQSDWHGVVVSGASPVIDGLDAISNQHSGVVVSGGSPVIDGLRAIGNGHSGVVVSGASPVIDGVRAMGNEHSGILFSDGSGGVVTNSTISSNSTGVEVDSTSCPTLGDLQISDPRYQGNNNLLCNSGYSVDNNNTGCTVMAENNWWGAAPPVSDTFGLVDREPYLGAPANGLITELRLNRKNDGADIELCWEDVAPCLGYRVYRCSDAGCTGLFEPISGVLTATCFTDVGAGLSPDDYCYKVEAAH